jgi:hypothetical protein
VLQRCEGLAQSCRHYFVPAVIEHGGAQGEAKQKNAPGLKTIEPSRQGVGPLWRDFM